MVTNVNAYMVPPNVFYGWVRPQGVVGGIGSEGYVSLEEGRRFVSVELKESYFKQAVANLKSHNQPKQSSLFEVSQSRVLDQQHERRIRR